MSVFRQLAAGALAALALATPAAAAEPLRLFEQLCVAGKARFARGEVVQAARAELPRPVRKALRPAPVETVYRVTGGPAFLIVQGGEGGPRTCALVTQDVALADVVAVMTGRAPTAAERRGYDAGASFRSAGAGYAMSGEIVPPYYIVATIRQDSAAPAGR